MNKICFFFFFSPDPDMMREILMCFNWKIFLLSLVFGYIDLFALGLNPTLHCRRRHYKNGEVKVHLVTSANVGSIPLKLSGVFL